MKQAIHAIFTVVCAATFLAKPADAQTELSPGKQDFPDAQKIYSPYVEVA